MGEWRLVDVSVDGKHWDKSLLPDEDMTITINNDGTLLQRMGDFREEGSWHVDKEGAIVMEDQSAAIDDEGYLVAEQNGLISRLAKK